MAEINKLFIPRIRITVRIKKIQQAKIPRAEIYKLALKKQRLTRSHSKEKANAICKKSKRR